MNLGDKTVLITGSTDGVGKLVAQRLAQAGAHVLLHGRSREKGQRTLAEIRAATGSDRLEFHLADLASLIEVRGLAEMVAARHEGFICSSTMPASASGRATPCAARSAATATNCASPSTTYRASCSRSSAAGLAPRRAGADRERFFGRATSDRFRRPDADARL